MKDIKIAVACHKPSRLPNNPIFVPIQVGSALAKNQMDMLHDDEGDNISRKNPYYCELTAQYWAWKNLDADYYGLCHYRRFLCFADVSNVPRNERGQIEAYAIDKYNLKRFGLENEQQMRAVIEENDMVVGELQKISKVYTPRGTQPTAYKHWVAHDRALIKREDLDLMLELLDSNFPELGRDTREYLNTDTFLGFNCFVMRKELFDEMCKIEFQILELLEKRVVLDQYCQNLQRIYGFMGEIICSSFIYHIEKKKKYKVKHVPLLYFNYTDMISEYIPEKSDVSIPVLFLHGNRFDFMFATAWKSFLEHTEDQYTYDVIIETSQMKAPVKRLYDEMAESKPNVKVRYLDHTLIENQIRERYKGDYPMLPFIPWILPKYKKMLVFDSQLLFADTVVPLWKIQADDTFRSNGCVAAAAYDAFTQAKVNDIFEETAYAPLSEKMVDPYSYVSASAMLVDFEKYREIFDRKSVFAACKSKKNESINSAEEVFNILCEGKIKIVEQRWNTWLVSNDYLNYILPYAPNSVYKELLEARKKPAIIRYEEDDPWRPQGNQLDILFWNYARSLPIYERYLAHMVNRCTYHESMQGKTFLAKAFPHGTARRKVAQFFFPYGSIQYEIARKLI